MCDLVYVCYYVKKKKKKSVPTNFCVFARLTFITSGHHEGRGPDNDRGDEGCTDTRAQFHIILALILYRLILFRL